MIILLVGPNGAGKSTLLNIAAGMLTPTAGTIEVCGGVPGSGPLAKVGYVAQSTPVYAGLTVEDHLHPGAQLNSTWDASLARQRVERIGLVALGILLRRTVTAMAVTLVVFAAVMVAVPLLVRPYLLPPTQETVTISAANVVGISAEEPGVVNGIILTRPPGALLLGNETVDPAGIRRLSGEEETT